MAVVDHVVREIAGSVVREPDDAPSVRDRRADDAEHGLALRAQGARGLRAGDAGAIELVRHAGVAIGALEVAQPAVVQVRDERGDGAHVLFARWPGAPHGGVEALDEVLIDARARGIRAQQDGGRIAVGHGASSWSLANDTTGSEVAEGQIRLDGSCRVAPAACGKWYHIIP